MRTRGWPFRKSKFRNRWRPAIYWPTAALVAAGVESIVLLYVCLSWNDPDLHLDGYLRFRNIMLGVQGGPPGAFSQLLWLNLLGVVALWSSVRGILIQQRSQDAPHIFTALTAATLLLWLNMIILLYSGHFEPVAPHGKMVREPDGRYELQLNTGSGLAHIQDDSGSSRKLSWCPRTQP